jgi:hypothetical protein
MNYNKKIFALARTEIEGLLLTMPMRFGSDTFLTDFASHHPRKYATIVQWYVTRGRRRANAIQIAHQQIMHTVKGRFGHLVKKIADIPNPKGGGMSQWQRI